VAHSTLLGLSQTEAILLARDLVEVAPKGLTRVFYSDAGATSVEVALKMAAQFHAQSGQPQRRKFMALGDAYHGDTMGAVSLGYSDWFHRTVKHLVFDVITAPSPVVDGDAHLAVQLIEEHGAELAAFVIEPVMQGAAGMIAQPKGYLAAVARACRKHGVLLICDEVATGFGRTGTMFACEQEGVVPDIMCVAKGLSGGYLPVAATLATERVFDAFRGAFSEGKTFFHGHTFTGNALGCAVSRASLKLMNEQVMPALPSRVTHLTSLLEPLKAHPHVREVRQRGLMVGVELQDRARQPYAPSLRLGHQVCMDVRKHGVILRPLGSVVVLMPPPAMPAELISVVVAAAIRSINDVTGRAS
jgi:adenosylmethionine-8-amino-7-oxononanoate aminotransferase